MNLVSRVHMRVAAAVPAALALVAGLAAQEQPATRSAATFRSGVTYVEVDAYVTTADNDPVGDLTVNDFELVDSGSPQRITTFLAVNLPITCAESPDNSGSLQRAVRTNTVVDGRVYLLVLDDLHVDAVRTPTVRAAVRRFVEQDLGPNDVAAVVSTSGRTDASADFTTDRRLLLDVIDRFMGQKLPSATLGQIQTARDAGFTDDYREKEGGFDNKKQTRPIAVGHDPDRQERAFRAQKMMATLRRLSDALAGVLGRRKAMVLVSEGVDYDVSRVLGDKGRNGAIVAEVEDVLRAATRANVAVYGVDPRELADASADLIETTTAFGPIGIASTQDALRMAHDSLRVLADNTGGFAAVDRNDLSSAFERIVQENSTYYLLGFSPSNGAFDGRYHKLEVRVRRPGLQVRSRPGYFAARPREAKLAAGPARSASAAVEQALASPLPIADVPLKVFAAAFKGTGVKATIELGIEIDASRLDFVEKNGTWNNAIDVAVALTDASGHAVPGPRTTIRLAMTPQVLSRVRTHGLRVLTEATLAPGRYRVHIGVADANGQAGSVLGSVDVPDFSNVPLAMSDLTLTATSAADIPTIGAKDPRLRTPPTASREFGADETLEVAGEIYESTSRLPHAVTILTQLRQRERVLQTVADHYASDEASGAAGRHAFTSTIPLSNVEPGTYVLRVEGRTSDGQPPARRDIEIRVQ